MCTLSAILIVTPWAQGRKLYFGSLSEPTSEGPDLLPIHCCYSTVSLAAPNPCAANGGQGQCSHLCLLHHNRSAACACPHLMKLSSDKKTCYGEFPTVHSHIWMDVSPILWAFRFYSEWSGRGFECLKEHIRCGWLRILLRIQLLFLGKLTIL